MSTQEAQLIDLPEQEEKPRVNICSPKIIILTILATYFISQNIYNYLMYPPSPSPPPQDIKVDEWANFWQMFERFKGYVLVSVIGFVIFFVLRRANDKHDEEEFAKIKKEEEEAYERERKKMAEREEKILNKLEEEERIATEKQMNMARSNSQQPTPNKQKSIQQTDQGGEQKSKHE